MLEPLPSFQKSIIPHHSTIVIGLSGGPDSIYLLHHLAQLQQELEIKLIAAHLDHEWQESSKIAVEICQEQCHDLKIPLVAKKLSELKLEVKWNGSQEEIGRKMRRHFFQTIAQEYKATAIALAHHQQDQHETFFLRLIRGSSLTGLTGMKIQDGLYIRPMLYCKKEDIIHYLHSQHIGYYTDPTNISDNYLRNRIRNHVIPALQSTDQRFEQKLSSTMEQLQQTEDFIEQHTLEVIKKIATHAGIEIPTFLQLHTIVQQRIILKMLIEHHVSFCPSQRLLQEIIRFLKTSSHSYHIIHASWSIQKSKTHFFIKKIEKNDKNL